MATTTTPPREWIASSQAEVARFFAVHRQTVTTWKSQGMPGRPKAYPLDEIARWLRADGPWRPQAQRMTAEDEPELVGYGDSPELERFRAARADLAEMERDERRGKLISAERLREICLTVGDVIKSLRRRLVKKFGVAAGEVVDGGLRDLRDIADRECGIDTS